VLTGCGIIPLPVDKAEAWGQPGFRLF